MATLCLLRHATAANADTDAMRPLTEHGKREAIGVGRWLVAGGYVPDRVLCSTAVRARETLAAVVKGAVSEAGSAPSGLQKTSITYDERLYLAPPDRLLGCIAGVDDACATLLVVAHNPGLIELAMHLAARDPKASAQLSRGFPPASLAVLRAQAPWTRFGLEPCQLIALKRD